jgi:hypothetical protein
VRWSKSEGGNGNDGSGASLETTLITQFSPNDPQVDGLIAAKFNGCSLVRACLNDSPGKFLSTPREAGATLSPGEVQHKVGGIVLRAIQDQNSRGSPEQAFSGFSAGWT